MKQIAVELYRDLEELGLAFMGKPGMGNIGPYQDQLPVVDLFHAIPNDPLDAFGVLDEIQLIFLMIMYGKIERSFMAGEHGEAIGFLQRRSLF